MTHSHASRIWALDFAREHPQVSQVDGLDISLDQVPRSAWLPANVAFHEYNVYEERPKELEHKYNIIHIRHLLAVVKGHDPTQVLTNVLKLLNTSNQDVPLSRLGN